VQSDLAQYSNTPILRAAGFEDDDEDSLSNVAFCARWLAVLSASEVGRTTRLVFLVYGKFETDDCFTDY